MSVAAVHRLVAAAVVGAALLATAYLLDARDGELALRDATRALSENRPQDALEDARRAGDGATVEGRAAGLAAAARLRMGDLRGATSDLERAVRARPNDWRLRRDLATAYAATGRVDDARAQAVRTLELNPRATLPSGFNVRAGGR